MSSAVIKKLACEMHRESRKTEKTRWLSGGLAETLQKAPLTLDYLSSDTH